MSIFTLLTFPPSNKDGMKIWFVFPPKKAKLKSVFRRCLGN
jgi:hypothetical protein